VVRSPPTSERRRVSAYIVTRINVGDYEAWRPMFDQDRPRAREKATVQRVLRGVHDPNQVFVFLEFASVDDAQEARTRLLESGVLDRFTDKHGPNVVVDADEA
jgi:histidinol-phosphate/aromatic aminotransferase/cobyric acid decarboxylase-like protein